MVVARNKGDVKIAEFQLELYVLCKTQFGHGRLSIDSPLFSLCKTWKSYWKMSRGGRGGRGRGFGRGRGGIGGNMLPMGLTFADIQSLSREEDALYPVRCYASCVIYCISWNNTL